MGTKNWIPTGGYRQKDHDMTGCLPAYRPDGCVPFNSTVHCYSAGLPTVLFFGFNFLDRVLLYRVAV
eukprot:scaffold3267_cov140-Cylindrotheca_fusiformis.AAC.17